MRWFRQITSSLLGLMAVSEVVFALPMCAFLLRQDYLDGNLTGSQTLLDVGACFIGGVLWALLFWYTVALPLMKKKEGKR
jgi:hypothetical protein